MKAWLCLAACAVLGLAPGWAGADATPRSLRVRTLPAIPPTNLRMRPAAAPGDPGADAERAGRRRDRDAQQPAGPTLAERVVFRFNIGFGLDGGQPSGDPRWWSNTPCGDDAGCLQQYTRNRIYGFGDAVIGTRGVLMSNLNGYFAAQFRFDQDLRGGFSAVPSVQDGTGVGNMQVRSGYGEIENMSRWRWLRPLYLRIGRQYRYGAAVAHFDGFTASYDTRVVSLGLFAGNSVSPFSLEEAREAREVDPIVGLNARLSLAALGLGPIVLTTHSLAHDGRTHADWGMAVRWRRDLDTQVRMRRLDGKLAQADAQVRTRLSAVTVATLDLAHHTTRDWRYDSFLTRPRSDITDVRRYLGLEPPGPRTYVSLRAGTVLLDNVDLLLRGTGVVEHDDPARDAATEDDSFASSYLEGGAALELRLQRTLSLGLSGVVRSYRTQARDLVELPVGDRVAEPLPAPGYAHARSFVEAGAVVRYTQGARLFNAEAEVYGRSYERELLYQTDDVPDADDRVGGRMAVESWAGERLRLRLEYDVTTGLDVLPELRGLKSLRMLMEGRF